MCEATGLFSAGTGFLFFIMFFPQLFIHGLCELNERNSVSVSHSNGPWSIVLQVLPNLQVSHVH